MQLPIRFPDGTAQACELDGPWVPFVHDGTALEWCPATWRSMQAAIARYYPT